MNNSTLPNSPSATPDLQELLALLQPQLQNLCAQLQAFRQQGLSQLD